jgi:hypothetical protein
MYDLAKDNAWLQGQKMCDRVAANQISSKVETLCIIF